MDEDPGWTTEGQWAFGNPQGLDGDPSSGYTGENVYGYNLAGKYANSQPQYWLTTPALDCSGTTNVVLRFQRWLQIESASYDHAYIQISSDGTRWQSVWSHSGSSLRTSAWQEMEYDISAYADENATVYLRWGMGTTDGSVNYCGWNIDDVEIWGVSIYDAELSLILPDNVAEGAGILTGAGQLLVSAAQPTNLVVTLRVDDEGELSVPEQLIIPAGQTNVYFDLTVLDDALLDGSKVVSVRAVSDGYGPGEASVLVHDNESASLALSLPPTIVEGRGTITGAVTIGQVADDDISVMLTSTNPDIIEGGNVVIRSGERMASFALPLVDNTYIDSIRAVTLEATVQNWVGDQASVVVFDNDAEGPTRPSIFSLDLDANVVQVMKDPMRPFAYAIDQSSGEVLFIDLDQMTVSTRLYVGESPTSFDMNVAGDTLYVANRGSGSGTSDGYLIAEVDLDTQTKTREFLTQYQPVNLVTGRDGVLYYNSGSYAAVVDTVTGTQTGGFGFRIKTMMVTKSDKSKLYGQYVYSGNLGEMGAFDISTDTILKTDRQPYSPYPYGWDYTNYSISGDDRFLAYGKILFNADNLTDQIGLFSELIYGLNNDASLAFGMSAIWDTTTFPEHGEAAKISDLPFSTSVMDFDDEEHRLYAFNNADQTLHIIAEPGYRELSISLTDHAVEADGVLTGEISCASAPVSNLVINLISDDSSEVLVSSRSIVIPAGSTRASFTVEVQDDADLDGSQSAVVHAWAAGYVEAAHELLVHDNESAVLTISLPQTTAEGAGSISGTVMVDQAPAEDIFVEISSMNPAKIESGSAVILAGETQSSFDLTVVDNSRMDGTQAVGIEAHVENWSGASASVSVSDNEVVGADHTSLFSLDLGVTVTQVLKDPVRPFVYAIDRSNSEILFVDLESMEVTKRLYVGKNPSSFDIDDSGNYLYVGHGGGGTGLPGSYQIAKVDLTSQEKINSFIIPTVYYNKSLLNAENVICGRGNIIYYNSGYTVWNGGLDRIMDGLTGDDFGSIARIKSPMVISSDKTKLYGQYIYSGNLGEMGVWDVSTNTIQKTDRYSYSPYLSNYGWAYNNYSISGDDRFLAYGKTLFNADNLADQSGLFSELIYALNNDASVAFGSSGMWDTTPFEEGGDAVKISDFSFSSTVMDFNDAEHMLYIFNGDDQTLHVMVEPGFLDLSISLAETATESEGVLTGEVTVALAPASDLVINLVSDDLTEVSVATNSVVIPAGSTHASFTVLVQDDAELDGSQSAVVHASAIGYVEAAHELLVHDNESAVLTLSLPQTTYEGAGTISGALQVSAAPDADIVVELNSNNPDKIGSSSIVIPAGQTFVSFALPVIDNAAIDGVQTATIEAKVQNWTTGSASVFVFDNETNGIQLELPASLREGDGVVTNAGTVSLAGRTSVDVHVLLSVSDASELIVPAFVTIPAGQTSASFNLSVIDDADLDGTQSISLLAEAPGYVPAHRLMDVVDDDIHHLELSLEEGEIAVLEPVQVGVSAKTVDGQPATLPAGPFTFEAYGDGGSVPVNPSAATNASSPIVFGRVDNNVVLAVDDGIGHSGTSAVFNVVGAVFVLEPAALTNTLVVAGESVTRTMVISNAGNADLEFTIIAPLTPEVPEIGNLIVNGDFEAGNTNFTSAYTYAATGNYLSKGTYFVGDDSQTWDADLSPTMNDHTSSTGQMLMAHGSMTSGAAVWEQEVAVVAGQTYTFSAWAAGLFALDLPTLDFQIDGSSIGSVATESLIWNEFAAEWTAASSGTVTLRIVDQLIIFPFFAGNTFAIDDIEFRPVVETAQDAGLIAHYPFNGSAADESGNGHDGTVNGATLVEDRFGNPDSAYDFNGSSAYINCGNIINGFSNFTVSAWVNIDRFTASDYMGPWSQQRFSYSVENGNYAFYTATHSSAGFGTTMLWDDGVGMDSRVGHTLPLNEWHLITQTYDGNEVRQYDNGELVNSTVTGAHSLSSEWDFLIGKAAGYPGYLSTKYFDGQIDELRIYDRALTKEEILMQYNSPAGDEPAVQGITVVSVTSEGPLASFLFNGNPHDESNGYMGTISGGATLTTDRFGNPDSAYSFDGEAYITYGDVLDRGDTSHTYNFWVKTSTFDQQAMLLGKGISTYGSPRYDGWSICNYPFDTGNGYHAIYGDHSGLSANMDRMGVSNEAIPTNEWVMLSGVYDIEGASAVLRLYVNGVLVGSESFPLPTTSSDDSLPFNIGGLYYGSGSMAAGSGFEGDIDDVTIYNCALSDSEIAVLYNETDAGVDAGLIASYPFNGNAADESGNGNDGTVNGATLTTDRFGNESSAYLFDGVDDFVVVPDASDLRLSGTDFTVSLWLNESERNASYNDAILTKRGSGSNNGWFSGILGNANSSSVRGKLTYQVSAGADPGGYSASVLSLSEWHHTVMAYSVSNQTLSIYIDGQLDSEHMGIPSPNAATTANMYIGLDSAAQGYAFHGTIDDVRIYNRMLSASEISALHNADDSNTEPETGAASWLTVNPTSGIIPPGSNVVVTATFNASGMMAGVYSNTTLTLTCNDSLTSSNGVEASMYVVPPAPSMLAEPAQTAGAENEVFWNAIEGPVSYWVEMAASTNATALQDSGWVAVTNHVFQGLEADTIYFYRARASVESSIGRLSGAWSDWVSSEQILSLIDGDGNGIPDWWEMQFFGQSGIDADLDTDGDGQINRDEYIAGMNPTNAGSCFMIESMDEITNGVFMITWESVTGRVYSVQWKSDMTDSFQTLETGIRHPQNSYTDTVHSVEDCGFYRIDVSTEN
ncbi:hypothetical protein P4C99_16270 [Pontiellaceae bacterium B1224]|nr:hypothetical protein [Pontiellaceae bacterium B1224]